MTLHIEMIIHNLIRSKHTLNTSVKVLIGKTDLLRLLHHFKIQSHFYHRDFYSVHSIYLYIALSTKVFFILLVLAHGTRYQRPDGKI